MIPPNTFANQSGAVPASELDENFTAAAGQTALDALTATVAALPSSTVPLTPVAAGSAGASAALSRVDHRHPPQSATPNTQTGTSYTLQATDDGGVVEFSNVAAIAVMAPNTLAAGFSCMLVQVGAGQVTYSVEGGGSMRQRAGYTKSAGQWAMVSMYVRANSGGTAAECVFGGDMTT